MASRAPAMHLRQYCRPPDGHHSIVKLFRERVAHVSFDARHFHRWQKFSVRQLWQSLGLAANSSKLFDVVVPWRDVRIADRPVHRDPVSQVRFKIEIAPAITLPSPGERFSADLAPPNPRKFLVRICGIGVLFVADEKL